MCHFLPVHHLGIAFLEGRVEGQNITYWYSVVRCLLSSFFFVLCSFLWWRIKHNFMKTYNFFFENFHLTHLLLQGTRWSREKTSTPSSRFSLLTEVELWFISWHFGIPPSPDSLVQLKSRLHRVTSNGFLKHLKWSARHKNFNNLLTTISSGEDFLLELGIFTTVEWRRCH